MYAAAAINAPKHDIFVRHYFYKLYQNWHKCTEDGYAAGRRQKCGSGTNTEPRKDCQDAN
jgi:hypothetical protein